MQCKAERRSRAQIVRVVAAIIVSGCMTAGAAHAAGPGLPLGYDVIRHNSPAPGAVAQYPLGLANAGDLDGDGKEDFITAQLVNTRNDAGIISATGNGAIYIYSGAANQRIKTIEAPDPGGSGNAANFAFPWVSKVGLNRTAPAPLTDIGRCASPPPNAGELCRAATIGPPDGVPDILVGARGVDARGQVDAGRVYIYDGATFALLKRIDQPASDVTAVALARQGGTWFGRTVLNPAGLPPCAGNAGVGDCDPPTVPACPAPATVECENNRNAVARGDVDGGGLPDIVIGASSTSEIADTAHDASHCAKTPNAVCQASGRVYVYRGEDVVGSSPTEILDGTVPAGGTTESITTIRNIHSQADPIGDPINSDPELFGNALQPVGDVGQCRATPTSPLPAPGELCPRDNGVTTQDGRPEFVIHAPRTDLPVDAPDPNFGDAGTSYLVDGKTSTILAVYRNPEPQLAATFGQIDTAYATGDLGDTGLPDVLVGSGAQNLSGFTGGGRAFVMNGNFKAGIGAFVVSRLDDPTPATSGNFARSGAGVGDLVPGGNTPRNEVVVGAATSRTGVISDIHIFNSATEKVLQTIADPDNQGASQFGEQIIPLGDLNGDTFLDFAVTAPLWDSSTLTDEGRVYIFRSNNTPPPPPPAPPAPPPAAAAAPPPPPPPPPPAAASDAAVLQPGRCANDLRGTNDGDSLIGTTAGDTIFGLDGDDVIEALGGHDCVDAGGDEDNVAGAGGNDSLLGGAAADELDGGSGADRVFGQTGDDVLSGGSGRDMLAGGEGNDTLAGGSGGDRLFGERGKDRLTAGDSGASLLDGGSGNDRIDSVNGRRDTVRCGAGYDRATVDRLDRASGCERVVRRRA